MNYMRDKVFESGDDIALFLENEKMIEDNTFETEIDLSMTSVLHPVSMRQKGSLRTANLSKYEQFLTLDKRGNIAANVDTVDITADDDIGNIILMEAVRHGNAIFVDGGYIVGDTEMPLNDEYTYVVGQSSRLSLQRKTGPLGRNAIIRNLAAANAFDSEKVRNAFVVYRDYHGYKKTISFNASTGNLPRFKPFYNGIKELGLDTKYWEFNQTSRMIYLEEKNAKTTCGYNPGIMIVLSDSGEYIALAQAVWRKCGSDVLRYVVQKEVSLEKGYSDNDAYEALSSTFKAIESGADNVAKNAEASKKIKNPTDIVTGFGKTNSNVVNFVKKRYKEMGSPEAINTKRLLGELILDENLFSGGQLHNPKEELRYMCGEQIAM